uniref:Uncharacterized protein n=1 Tax=Tetraselmis chuii TaxID=63592 RepID=A0A7S1X4X5_9CHLO|mmetsp:Transcript_28730/g.51372  ORF Transcript_28730/g.51372 Transcript_28730/m.51372 type:complete len:190 (+) Transcript_28730:153-722(+)
MGGLLSRGSASSGRSLAQAAKSREPFTVRLTEEALKPRPRDASELQQLSEAQRQRVQEEGAPVQSEYAIEYEEKDKSLDSMLVDLGDSLQRHRVNIYDQQMLDAARERHVKKTQAVQGRIIPDQLLEIYEQYYQKRSESGDSREVVEGLAKQYGVDAELLQRLMDTTCLPLVRNVQTEGRDVRMHAEWR